MATGKSPFVGDDPIVVIRQVIDVVPARPDRIVPGLRAGLSNLIMRLLEKDPAKRPGSAREVAKELAELETGRTRQTSKRLRNIIVVGVAIAACCAWAVGLGIVFRPKPKESIQSAAQWDSTWHLDPSRIRESERWPNQPPELVAVIGAQTRRHWGPVHAVSSAENGSMLVTDSPGDGVRFWNPQTMAPLGRAPSRQDFIRAIAVTRDGKRFITTNRNGQFEVWDIDPPTAKRSVPLIYSDAPVGGIVIDSTGSRVFVSDFADGTVREYSLSETELKPRRVFKEKLGEAWSLAISPDGHWLAASSKTGAVGVWDLQESEPRFRSVREKSRGDNFVDLVFARDSKSLYLVSQGTRNAVYDLSTGGPKKFVDFTSGTDMPWAAYIDGSGKRLIRVGQRSVAVYNLGNNMPTVIRSIEVPFAILGAAYDPRLERVYTGHDDGGVRAWDVSGTTPTEIEPLLYQPFARMAVSPDGHFAAIHRKLGGTQAMLDLFDLSGVEPKPAPLPNPAYEAAFGWPAFSDDGKSLFAVDDRSNQISRWDFSGVSAYARILGKTRPSRIARAPKTPRLLCVSADGQRLVNFDLAGSSHFVVDANGRSQPLTAGENSKGLVIVDGSFDSDGDGILALGKQGEAGRLIHWKSPDRSPKVKSLPEGISWRWLLVARKEETILGVGDRGVFELAIDWDAKLPRQVFDLEADDANVRALAVSGDGKRLAIATGGGRLVVQDRSTHVIKYDWRLPGAPAQIAFTLNGSGLITANPNGAVYVFRLDLNQP
jgi:WD40 repeat protein